MKKIKTKVQEEILEEPVERFLCKFETCWHYGTCLYTGTGWEHPPTKPPELNKETKKPQCFLAKDWFRPKKIKKESSLEELAAARKEAKRRKKEKEEDF